MGQRDLSQATICYRVNVTHVTQIETIIVEYNPYAFFLAHVDV